MEKDGVRAALKRWEWEVRVVESDGARAPPRLQGGEPWPGMSQTLTEAGPGPQLPGSRAS